MLDFCLSVSQVLGGLSSIYNLTYQIKDWSLSLWIYSAKVIIHPLSLFQLQLSNENYLLGRR